MPSSGASPSRSPPPNPLPSLLSVRLSILPSSTLGGNLDLERVRERTGLAAPCRGHLWRRSEVAGHVVPAGGRLSPARLRTRGDGRKPPRVAGGAPSPLLFLVLFPNPVLGVTWRRGSRPSSVDARPSRSCVSTLAHRFLAILLCTSVLENASCGCSRAFACDHETNAVAPGGDSLRG